jgi:hypothetical protein
MALTFLRAGEMYLLAAVISFAVALLIKGIYWAMRFARKQRENSSAV